MKKSKKIKNILMSISITILATLIIFSLFQVAYLNKNLSKESLPLVSATPTPSPSPDLMTAKDFDDGIDYETASYIEVYNGGLCSTYSTFAKDQCIDEDILLEVYATNALDTEICGKEQCCPAARDTLVSCSEYCNVQYNVCGKCESKTITTNNAGQQSAGYCKCAPYCV